MLSHLFSILLNLALQYMHIYTIDIVCHKVKFLSDLTFSSRSSKFIDYLHVGSL